jgi:LysR family transcriptional regulator, nod-box dependent transcriptional activator
VPYLLVGTARLSLMHERLVRISAKGFDISYRPLPVAFEPLRELVQINEARIADRGVRWLIEQIRTEAGRIT